MRDSRHHARARIRHLARLRLETLEDRSLLSASPVFLDDPVVSEEYVEDVGEIVYLDDIEIGQLDEYVEDGGVYETYEEFVDEGVYDDSAYWTMIDDSGEYVGEEYVGEEFVYEEVVYEEVGDPVPFEVPYDQDLSWIYESTVGPDAGTGEVVELDPIDVVFTDDEPWIYWSMITPDAGGEKLDDLAEPITGEFTFVRDDETGMVFCTCTTGVIDLDGELLPEVPLAFERELFVPTSAGVTDDVVSLEADFVPEAAWTSGPALAPTTPTVVETPPASLPVNTFDTRYLAVALDGSEVTTALDTAAEEEKAAAFDQPADDSTDHAAAPVSEPATPAAVPAKKAATFSLPETTEQPF